MSDAISPDTIIGQYTVVSKIGEGGMGEVYRARDTKLSPVVAIKVLPAAFSEDSERLGRFEQEAQAAGSLNHPNILVIFHIGMHQGAPYIVSELLEGETLRERMAGGALPQRKAIDYALQTARGLAAAHEKESFIATSNPTTSLSPMTAASKYSTLDWPSSAARPMGFNHRPKRRRER